MRDPFFGHRDWFTGEPTGDRDEKTDWDYALISAYQIIQDNTGNDGVLIWENESENVIVNADRKFSKFEAARQRKTSGARYKAAPGELYVPDVQLLTGEWPTYSGWVNSLVEKDGDGTIEG